MHLLDDRLITAVRCTLADRFRIIADARRREYAYRVFALVAGAKFAATDSSAAIDERTECPVKSCVMRGLERPEANRNALEKSTGGIALAMRDRHAKNLCLSSPESLSASLSTAGRRVHTLHPFAQIRHGGRHVTPCISTWSCFRPSWRRVGDIPARLL